jgi:hypothetical protein
MNIPDKSRTSTLPSPQGEGPGVRSELQQSSTFSIIFTFFSTKIKIFAFL